MSHTDGAAGAARQTRVALESLLADAPAIEAGLPAGSLDRIERFVQLLLEANARLNLTRVVEPGDVARLHLLDAFAALPLLDAAPPGAAVDLGSGGGVPALPLALVRPDWRWTLVESVGKKAAALEGFVDALGLGSVAVVAQRAEVVGHDPRHRERSIVATARAVASLPVLCELALPLVALGGQVIAWKGPLADDDDEIRRARVATGQLGGGALRIVDPELPVLGGHRLVVVPKDRPTPDRFPRRPGVAARRPLG